MTKPWAILAMSLGAGLVAVLLYLFFIADTSSSPQAPAEPADETERFIQTAERLAVEAHAASTQARLEGVERELQRHYRSLSKTSDEAISAANHCHLAISKRKSELMEELNRYR